MVGLLASERRMESGENRTLLAENSDIEQDGRQSAVKDQGGRKLTIAVLGVCAAVVLVALAARSGGSDAATASEPPQRKYETNFMDSPSTRLAEAELEGAVASTQAVQADAEGGIAVAINTDYTETSAAEEVGMEDWSRGGGLALEAEAAEGELTCADSGEDCTRSGCCQGEGLQCFAQASNYAGCLAACTNETWSCATLGKRTPLTNPGCSGLNENCLLTQCCTLPGTQCFMKNDFWGTCAYSCDSNEGWSKDWSCMKLGEVQPEVCAWSGGACTYSKKCCHPGASCYQKNSLEAYCSNTPDNDVGADWDGSVLGGSMSEFPVQPVKDASLAKGTTLFCFMAVLPGSPEEQLRALAESKHASIYACDGHMTTSSSHADMKAWDSGDNTLVNTEVFVQVWRNVKQDGQYKSFDWTVKVDPDNVFFPDRLRYHLQQLRAPRNFPIYIKNTDKEFGFLGAIEVFSVEAMDKYFGKDNIDDNDKHCFREISSNSGEDGFMKGCMDMLGAGYMTDIEVLHTPYETNCNIPSRVCFHAFKDTGKWEGCYNAAVR